MIIKLAAATGASFELHYCCRSRSRAAFADYLQQVSWSERVSFHFDDEEQRLEARAVMQQAPADSHLYCCGPSGFINWVCDTATSEYWSDERIHFERFSADPDALVVGDAFEIQLLKSGQIIPVSADQTAAQALLANGVDVAISCEQGICGSCLLPVVDGTPDHRDLFRTEAEKASNSQFTPCCSRARSRRLVVDI